MDAGRKRQVAFGGAIVSVIGILVALPSAWVDLRELIWGDDTPVIITAEGRTESESPAPSVPAGECGERGAPRTERLGIETWQGESCRDVIAIDDAQQLGLGVRFSSSEITILPQPFQLRAPGTPEDTFLVCVWLDASVWEQFVDAHRWDTCLGPGSGMAAPEFQSDLILDPTAANAFVSTRVLDLGDGRVSFDIARVGGTPVADLQEDVFLAIMRYGPGEGLADDYPSPVELIRLTVAR